MFLHYCAQSTSVSWNGLKTTLTLTLTQHRIVWAKLHSAHKPKVDRHSRSTCIIRQSALQYNRHTVSIHVLLVQAVRCIWRTRPQLHWPLQVLHSAAALVLRSQSRFLWCFCLTYDDLRRKNNLVLPLAGTSTSGLGLNVLSALSSWQHCLTLCSWRKSLRPTLAFLTEITSEWHRSTESFWSYFSSVFQFWSTTPTLQFFTFFFFAF